MIQQAQTTYRQFLAWLLQDEHRRKAKHLRDEARKAFTEHPELTGETYLQHLWFTVRISARFILTSFVLTTHGLFPFIFTRAASDEIERVNTIMRSRIRRPGPTRDRASTQTPCVGIVGGGFSGTLTLANLVRQTQGPLTIEWFDEGRALAEGVAYGTRENIHLLNVRADRMGAFAGEPNGFFTWLGTPEGKAAAAEWGAADDIREDAFLPRALYGAYLKAILADALQTANAKGIDVRTNHASVIDAEPHGDQLMLSVEKGHLVRELRVDTLVLATGNLPPRPFSFQPGLVRGVTHYVADIWQPVKGSMFPGDVGALSADSEIVVIGTGLTMVDSILTLRKHGYKGTITAISRHGLMPAPHAPAQPYAPWPWTQSPATAPQTALALLRGLRYEIRQAAKQGYDWRSVIDSLRPVTQTLWKRLSTSERRKFMRRLFTLWNVQRHRMAPQIHAELKTLQASGALKVIAGRIYYVGTDEEGTTVAYRKRGANRVETIRAALVLNCTGPEYDIAASTHRLLKNLRDRELITVGPLRMGVEITAGGSARGKLADTIFPVGTLLVGELLECTAVPELRDQAGNVATAVAKYIQLWLRGDNVTERLLGAWI